MKVALISFHKNIERYPQRWIEKYRNSILSQTFTNFDIFELNYGAGNEQIFKDSNFKSIALSDHAQAHNFLLNLCFSLGYDAVLNTNVDDYYPINRVEFQIKSFDPTVAVSSGNYHAFSEDGKKYEPTAFHKMQISTEFSKNHNIIAHPACCYSRKIMEYSEKLLSEEIPVDDFQLWKRLLARGAKFNILPNVLLHYRISDLKTKN